MQYHSGLCKIFSTSVYNIFENFCENRTSILKLEKKYKNSSSIFTENFYESKKISMKVKNRNDLIKDAQILKNIIFQAEQIWTKQNILS